MSLIKISRPDGGNAGWIDASLIVAVDALPQYIQYRDGEQTKHATKPYDTPLDEWKKAIGIAT